MSLFGDIDNAKFGDRNPDLTPGYTYVLEIEKAEAFRSRKNVPYAVTNFKVIETTPEGSPNNPGTGAKHMINLAIDASAGNVKNLVAAILNVSDKEKSTPYGTWTQATQEIFESGKNPAKNIRVKCEVKNITKKNGELFPLHAYAPVETASATPVPATGATTATAPATTGKASKTK